jgi:hypothetical protein
LRVVRVETNSAHVRARLEPPHQDDAGRLAQVVRLEVLPNHPEGRYEVTLALFTNDPDYRELRVPFTVVKRGVARVTAAPAAVEVPAVASGPPPARLVQLRAAGDEEVVVDRVEADDPAIVCVWAKGPESRATLKVRLDPARLDPVGVHGIVRVYLRRPVEETIIIPVSYMPR